MFIHFEGYVSGCALVQSAGLPFDRSGVKICVEISVPFSPLSNSAIMSSLLGPYAVGEKMRLRSRERTGHLPSYAEAESTIKDYVT